MVVKGVVVTKEVDLTQGKGGFQVGLVVVNGREGAKRNAVANGDGLVTSLEYCEHSSRAHHMRRS